MFFVYSAHYNSRLSLGGETCLKHLSRKHPGVGTAFLFQGILSRGGKKDENWRDRLLLL
jgi:hypothetical protein